MLRNISKLILPVFCMYLVILSVVKLTEYRFAQLAQDKFASQYVTAAERDRQLTCLARNIYFESATEPFEGKVAVAQVTLNRAASGQFPSDICGVVYQKNVFVQRTVCQFSWYCNSPSVLKVRDPAQYNESMEVAKKVLLEGFRLSGLTDALYYHADYVHPGWRKEKITQIGRHIFYRG
jgi:spore germination cell wall hydrolase CwlJ-like protein